MFSFQNFWMQAKFREHSVIGTAPFRKNKVLLAAGCLFLAGFLTRRKNALVAGV